MSNVSILSPDNVANNQAYITLANAILLAYLALEHFTRGIQATNFSGIVHRELVTAQHLSIHPATCDGAVYVCPFIAADDVGDRAASHTIFLPKLIMGCAALCITLTNLAHLGFGQNMSTVLFALYVTFATFLYHVLCIVFGRPREEMGRIAAKWRVASMTAQHFIGNWAIGQFIGDSMRRKHLAIITLKLPVTLHRRGLPQPAIIGAAFIDMRPEAFSEWNFQTFGVMTRKITGLASCAFRYTNGLTTATLTQWGKMEFRLRGMRGMIGHGGDASNIVAMTAVVFSALCGQLLRLFLPYFSTFERVQQPIGGAA